MPLRAHRILHTNCSRDRCHSWVCSAKNMRKYQIFYRFIFNLFCYTSFWYMFLFVRIEYIKFLMRIVHTYLHNCIVTFSEFFTHLFFYVSFVYLYVYIFTFVVDVFELYCYRAANVLICSSWKRTNVLSTFSRLLIHKKNVPKHIGKNNTSN